MSPYTGFVDCVPQAIRDSWNHYQWIGSRPHPRPEWAKYQKHAHTVYLRAGPEGLNALKARVDAFNKSNVDGTLKTNDELRDFFEGIRRDMTEKIEQRRKVENWEAERRLAHKEETQIILNQRKEAIEQKAASMVPSMTRADLEKLASFKNAILIAKPFTKRSWQELQPKLLVQLKELQDKEARKAVEREEARAAKAKADQEAVDQEFARIQKADAEREDSDRFALGHIKFSGNINVIPDYCHAHSTSGGTTCGYQHHHSNHMDTNTGRSSEIPAPSPSGTINTSAASFLAHLANPTNPSSIRYLGTDTFPTLSSHLPGAFDNHSRQLGGPGF